MSCGASILSGAVTSGLRVRRITIAFKLCGNRPVLPFLCSFLDKRHNLIKKDCGSISERNKYFSEDILDPGSGIKLTQEMNM